MTIEEPEEHLGISNVLLVIILIHVFVQKNKHASEAGIKQVKMYQ